MNSTLKHKLLQHLSAKRANGGFTLIELLVVVIIVGILAAVALPNLLGQIGKARETEGKNATGTILRAEQAFHFENTNFIAVPTGTFTGNNVLGVTLQLDFYEQPDVLVDSALGSEGATVQLDNVQAIEDGTRTYAGAISFDTSNGTYQQLICQSDIAATGLAALTSVAQPTNAVPLGGCAAGSTPVVGLGN